MRLPGRMTALWKSKQKRVERGKLRQAYVLLITQFPDVPPQRARITPRCGGRSGAPMSSRESRSPPTFETTSENRSREHSGGWTLAAARRSALGEIGFVGLGRMGAAMA